MIIDEKNKEKEKNVMRNGKEWMINNWREGIETGNWKETAVGWKRDKEYYRGLRETTVWIVCLSSIRKCRLRLFDPS